MGRVTGRPYVMVTGAKIEKRERVLRVRRGVLQSCWQYLFSLFLFSITVNETFCQKSFWMRYCWQLPPRAFRRTGLGWHGPMGVPPVSDPLPFPRSISQTALILEKSMMFSDTDLNLRRGGGVDRHGWKGRRQTIRVTERTLWTSNENDSDLSPFRDVALLENWLARMQRFAFAFGMQLWFSEQGGHGFRSGMKQTTLFAPSSGPFAEHVCFSREGKPKKTMREVYLNFHTLSCPSTSKAKKNETLRKLNRDRKTLNELGWITPTRRQKITMPITSICKKEHCKNPNKNMHESARLSENALPPQSSDYPPCQLGQMYNGNKMHLYFIFQD